jgi:hypothetical protein
MLESNTVDVETSRHLGHPPPLDDEYEPAAKEEGHEVEEVE